jgi:hypothetical protein
VNNDSAEVGTEVENGIVARTRQSGAESGFGLGFTRSSVSRVRWEGRARRQLGARACLRLCAVVVVGLVVGGMLAAPSLAATHVLLSWPEGRMPIGNGEQLVIETNFLTRSTPPIPLCDSGALATVVSNGAATDEIRTTKQGIWEECGATEVAGGFTHIALRDNSLSAVARPPISLTEPGPCVYSLARVEGSGALAGIRASFPVSGTATLHESEHGSQCPASLQVRGAVGLFGPQSGGSAPVLWKLEHTNPRGALAALNAYWADIGAGEFGTAYGILAPRAIGETRRGFVESESRARIRRVEFRGLLVSHHADRGTPGREDATVAVRSLVTRDEASGCLVWSGTYHMVWEANSRRIKRALLSSRPCA